MILGPPTVQASFYHCLLNEFLLDLLFEKSLSDLLTDVDVGVVFWTAVSTLPNLEFSRVLKLRTLLKSVFKRLELVGLRLKLRLALLLASVCDELLRALLTEVHWKP